MSTAIPIPIPSTSRPGRMTKAALTPIPASICARAPTKRRPSISGWIPLCTAMPMTASIWSMTAFRTGATPNTGWCAGQEITRTAYTPTLSMMAAGQETTGFTVPGTIQRPPRSTPSRRPTWNSTASNGTTNTVRCKSKTYGSSSGSSTSTWKRPRSSPCSAWTTRMC